MVIANCVPDNGTNGYSVTTNGQNVHPNFWGHDHTTGTGNFMTVNGHGTTYSMESNDSSTTKHQLLFCSMGNESE